MPLLPTELRHEILLLSLFPRDYIHPQDNIANIIMNNILLANVCLVSKHWRDVAQPLLYRHVAFWDPDVEDRDLYLLERFLETISTHSHFALLVRSLFAGVDLSLGKRTETVLLPHLRHLVNLQTLSFAPGAETDAAFRDKTLSLHPEALVFEWQGRSAPATFPHVADVSRLKMLSLRSISLSRLLERFDFSQSLVLPLSSSATGYRRPRLGALRDLRLYDLNYHSGALDDLVSAIGPHLEVLHLTLQSGFGPYPIVFPSFPNLIQLSLPCVSGEGDHNFLFSPDVNIVASSLRLLLIGDPSSWSLPDHTHPSILRIGDDLEDIFELSPLRLPSLEAVGFWKLNFNRAEDRESLEVARASRIFARYGIELRDRLGVCWEEEWAVILVDDNGKEVEPLASRERASTHVGADRRMEEEWEEVEDQDEMDREVADLEEDRTAHGDA